MWSVSGGAHWCEPLIWAGQVRCGQCNRQATDRSGAQPHLGHAEEQSGLEEAEEGPGDKLSSHDCEIAILNCDIKVVNKFPHAHFTTKIGIHSCLQNLHWFTNFSMNNFFPRCYQVRGEKFLKGFKKTSIDTYFKRYLSLRKERLSSRITD